MYLISENEGALIKDIKFLKENYPSDKPPDFLLPSLFLKAPVLKARKLGSARIEVEFGAGHWATCSSDNTVADDISTTPDTFDLILIYAGKSNTIDRRRRDKLCCGLLVERIDLAGGGVAYRRLGVGSVYYTTHGGLHRTILQSPVSEILLV